MLAHISKQDTSFEKHTSSSEKRIVSFEKQHSSFETNAKNNFDGIVVYTCKLGGNYVPHLLKYVNHYKIDESMGD